MTGNMKEKWNKEVLDGVINDMVDVVEKSKDEVYYITEEARSEYERLTKELAEIREKVASYIEENDSLEREVSVSRKQLSYVSQRFDKYSEDEIRNVYERTHDLQTQLVVIREEERSLRVKRNDIERRLISLEETVERATGILKENDSLEREVSVSRKQLSYVSQRFDKYSEDEIRNVYERTHDLQTQLVVIREEERSLRVKRNDIERRLISLEETVERATGIL